MREEVGVLFPRGDAEIISEMVKWWRSLPKKGPITPDPPTAPASEVYIAKTPVAGIASRTDEAGTGTDSSIADANVADCYLYRIDHKSSTDIEVEPIGMQRPVYNLGSAAIPGNQLILAVRDKTGKFIAVDLAGGVGEDCLWGQLIEEGDAEDVFGFYSWREMVENAAGGFDVKAGGRRGYYYGGAARCSSLKQAVALGIVVKLCRGEDFAGSGTYSESIWWFTTPDLDQDIICLEDDAGVGTAGAQTCTYEGETYAVPSNWSSAAVTKYNPVHDTWFRKGTCFLKHANGMPLVSEQRYRGHLCGFSQCGDPVYTTTDCCIVPNDGDNGGGGDGGGGGPGTGTSIDNCCDPPPPLDPGNPGGGGGTIECCHYELNAVLYASIPGNGSITMTYNGSDAWLGHKALACGETLWLKFLKATCNLEYCCDGVTYFAAGNSLTSPGSFACEPDFHSASFGPDMDNQLGPSGCVPGLCGIIDPVIVTE